MCGIAGIVSATPLASHAYQREADRLLGLIANRGPDGSGRFSSPDGRVCLVHSRLAVIDPDPRADQPFIDPESGAAIIYNGEIYNFRDLRADLARQGISFRSSSDTEVILKGYLKEGPSFFSRLRGMYAFVIFDPATEIAVAVRDPLGIKPLYLGVTPSQVRFGSTPAAACDDRPRLSAAAAVSLAVLGAVIEPLSPVVGVAPARPGTMHRIRMSDGRVEVSEEAIPPCFPWTATPHDRDLDVFKRALQETVHAHFTSDVPVAIFQSAGLDSAVLSTLARELGHAPTLFTIGFEGFRGSPNDEVPGAAATALRLGLTHHFEYLSDRDLAELSAAFLVDMQSPTADGFNVYLASRLCRAHGFKVALSGAGGDELLAGYPSFRQLPALNGLGAIARTQVGGLLLDASMQALSWMSPQRSPKLRYLARYLGDWTGRYMMRRAYFAPEELPDVLEKDVIAEGEPAFWAAFAEQCERSVTHDEAGVRALEMDVYLRNILLRDADWTGMAHGVEIRTPFVDLPLLRQLCSPDLNCAYRKEDLRTLLHSITPDGPGPQQTKTGFMVPHPSPWKGPAVARQSAAHGLRQWNRRVLAHCFPDWVIQA